MTEIIVRLPSVQAITALSRSSIYDGISKGTFPKPIKLSARAVGWRTSDIEAWLNSRETTAG